MRSTLLFLFVLALGACRPDVQRTAEGQPGQPSDSVRDRAGDTIVTASAGVELEAPRLIPGLRAQLSALSDTGGGATPENIAAYRQLSADVVDAMETDLNRLGSTEAEAVSEMGDSVSHLIGGGAGEVPEPNQEELRRSVAMMEQLIERYQSAMRAVRP